MQFISNEPTLADIRKEISKLRDEVKDIRKELGQPQKWQDRTWDVLKWVGAISAGFSVCAAIALVGLLLRLGGAAQ